MMSGDGLHLTLKTEVLKAFKRLEQTPNWSLALLVPAKKLMLSVSDYLASSQKLDRNRKLPPIGHDVALETAGPALSAIVISYLLERGQSDQEVQFLLLSNLIEHIRGRNGADGPSQANLKITAAIKTYLNTGSITGAKRKLIIAEAHLIAQAVRGIQFSGDPAVDWVSIRNLLLNSQSEEFRQVAIDAQYLRLLRKGALLNAGLTNVWRRRGNYQGAASIVRSALAQEHFSSSTVVWKGLHVMTMHKAKGKEFDEVIIYDGLYSGRIVWPNTKPSDRHQSRLALRVAVTRAKLRTTIFTPAKDPCLFLY